MRTRQDKPCCDSVEIHQRLRAEFRVKCLLACLFASAIPVVVMMG